MQRMDSTTDIVEGIHSSVVYPSAIVKAEFPNSSSCEIPSEVDFLSPSSTIGLDSEEELSEDQQEILDFLNFLEKFTNSDSGERSDMIVETSFRCLMCNQSFADRGHLWRHSLVHTGEKPFKRFACSICNKTFEKKASMLLHKYTHTGVKPYSCSVCGKSFKRKKFCF